MAKHIENPLEEVRRKQKYLPLELRPLPTKDDKAQMRGYKVYDCALPQTWVDEQNRKLGFPGNVCAHFVWTYDKCGYFGEPGPIDKIGDQWLVNSYGTTHKSVV